MQEEYMKNKIAPDQQFQIVCPYCFNRAAGGKPFAHTEVKFRAETSFSGRDIESRVGKKIDIEMMSSQSLKEEKLKEYEKYERFLSKTDEVYQDFWSEYDGTTEQNESLGGVNPWEMPIIEPEKGVRQLFADKSGFVNRAIDDFGRETYRRVCPHCHNPLPLGYGKYPVKYISIIGVKGSGKTVYISQLLNGMTDYAAKVRLNAYFTSEHEANFIRENPVGKNMSLPNSTTPNRLTQPMFYDIVKEQNGKRETNTIVLYDIAGENCVKAQAMLQFSQFVKHSDGLILMIDPAQLGFLVGSDVSEEDKVAPGSALNTLHMVIEEERTQKCSIPIAVCVSKSDLCTEILPLIAQEQVRSAELDANGLPEQKFDGRSYNTLSQGLTKLLQQTASSVCQALQDGYWNFNFFAVSAIGCRCEINGQGRSAPVSEPDPKRIEEPILWLFKQFGYIRSNEKVLRPFQIRQPRQPEPVKPTLWQRITRRIPETKVAYAVYEEDKILQ